MPKALVDHPSFESKTYINKSLETDSLSKALRLRDELNANLEKLIRGDSVAEYQLAYKSLIDTYGHPATVDKHSDAMEGLGCAISQHMDSYETIINGEPILKAEHKEDVELKASIDYLVVNDFEVLSLEHTTLEDSCVTESVVVRHKATRQLFKAVA